MDDTSARFKSSLLSKLLLVASILFTFSICQRSSAQQQASANFLVPGHNMENLRIPELTAVDTIVYTLKAVDPKNEDRKFSYQMTKGDTFKVDELTGEVKLIRPLDRERQAKMMVVVSVFDQNDQTLLDSRQRTITVEDQDDSWPVFNVHKQYSASGLNSPNNLYQVSISEKVPSGSSIVSEILVTDADEGSNADVVFECRPRQSTNAACEVFSIDSRRQASGRYSISVKTRTPLDYEQVQSYRLAFVARGKRPSPLKGQPLETEAVINIGVINVQDEGPVFVNAPYSLSMQEGLPNGTRLLNLIVQDGDAAAQRDLSVVIAPGSFSEHFQVVQDSEQPKLWYLETNAVLDREGPLISALGNMFTISLVAVELDANSSMPVASEAELENALWSPNYSNGTVKKENVTIVVLDLPDSRPVFLRASTNEPLSYLVVNVSESLVSGASVPNLDLAVRDLDQGINSRFRLTLVDAEVGPQASNAFALDSETIYGKTEVVLNVLNSSLLDFENPTLRVYKFSLVASKNQDPPIVQMLEVQINILDANDNAPEFDRDQYIVEVPEGALPGTMVAQIRARDRDSGNFGRIDYLLLGMGASRFKLVSSEGKIIVNDCGVAQCLDFEVQPSFSLTYEARDGGAKTKNVSVIINLIDINDHRPQFTESVYKRELISDNLSSKQTYISPQLIVRAKDNDGPTQGRNNVTYKIRNTNLTGLDVDPSSGLVYLSQQVDLNNMISAMNNADNIGNRPDKKIIFEAELVATDNGSPAQNSTAKIVLVVKGNRDGAPQFKQDLFQAYVRENQPVHKAFFQVQAFDPDDKDSQLRYSLGYDLNDLISVNPISGEISFKTKVDYDDFKGEPYNITVYATDNSRPYPLRASSIVSILIQDVNDKAPKFDEREYKATLVQGVSKQGDVVLQINAVDLDRNARLEYSIIVDELLVHDRNGEEFTLDKLANSSSGYLAQMSKPDRTQLVNSLRHLFKINRSTGAIEMKAEPDYSFVASMSISVRVVDLNQEIFKPTGELQEDFAICNFFFQTHIDQSPIFAPPWSIDKRDYNVSMLEELSIGAPIFSLLAKDPATNTRVEMFEKVFASDPGDYFRVDRTGVVSVNKRIDYEELPAPKRMIVSVKALTGDTYFSVANLIIQVVDLNDNAPLFRSQNYTVSVSESVVYPQEIITVTADDRDSSEFSQVYYSLSGYSSDLFAIDPRKGSIIVRKGIKLDRDTEPNHPLLVTASDCNETLKSIDHQHLEVLTGRLEQAGQATANCKRSSILVSISLSDENDNDPVFVNVNKAGELEAIASETVSVGSVLAQAIATDIDEGLNGQVDYEIVRGDDIASKLVKIDRDGYISVAEPLSGMGRSKPYRITIRAFDNGKLQSRQSYASLLLTISDVVSNDGVPKFVKPLPNEIVYLNENTGPNTLVYQVRAIDPDEEQNGTIMYKFIQPSDTFDIDPFHGTIKTANKPKIHIDRELIPNYTLVIVATDLGSPPKQAHQVLTVKITDVNDNEPYFERGFDDPPLVLHVEEEVESDYLVGSIQAVDKDEGRNALIGYEILEGNQNNMFRLDYGQLKDANSTSGDVGVDNNACRIYTTGRLDRETRESYILTIRASSMSKRVGFPHQLRDPLGGRNPFNQYNASDLTKIRVNITLLDINDNRPVFSQQNIKSVVDSSAEEYSQLMVFQATDADLLTSPIQYSILEVLYYSDSKFDRYDDDYLSSANTAQRYSSQQAPISMMQVFDIDPRTGILRNTASLRPFVDGYFEVFVKADSGLLQYQMGRENDDSAAYNQLGNRKQPDSVARCQETNQEGLANKSPFSNLSSHGSTPFADIENCFVAVAKAIVFVTHQRETFRFVFNKTRLNGRLDEFKNKVQEALEELMFQPAQTLASSQQYSASDPIRAERVYLNTFDNSFIEHEDGSMDFSTFTACSQLVRFDDRNSLRGDSVIPQDGTFARSSPVQGNTIVPNQVVNYDEVLKLLKRLNTTQPQQKASLFSQYGLVNVERCLPDKILYRMSLAERLALYFAAMIAVVSALLALIVSKMRKSYERNLKLLQRSKYQYMSSPYATLPPNAAQIPRPQHHMSLGALQGNNFIVPPYGSHGEYDGPAALDTWQL